MTSLDRVLVKTNDDDDNHINNDDDKKTLPHVAKQGPLRALKRAERMVSSYFQRLVSRP